MKVLKENVNLCIVVVVFFVVFWVYFSLIQFGISIKLFFFKIKSMSHPTEEILFACDLISEAGFNLLYNYFLIALESIDIACRFFKMFT